MHSFNHPKPGTTLRTLIATETTPVTRVPLIIVRGVASGPTLLVTAGVHGAEYVSIEAANRLSNLDPSQITGTLVVLPIVNLPSFEARSIYVNPIDGKNLNRVFPGDKHGTFAEQLAFWLTGNFIAHADAYVDLHGGDLNEVLTPFVICHQQDSKAESLAGAFGIPNVVPSTSSGHSYSAGYAYAVPSLLAESGGQGRVSDEDIAWLTDGVQGVMQHMGMLAGTPAKALITSYEAFHWLRSSFSGSWYLKVAPGELVVPQQQLGVVKDLLGNVVQEAISPVSGKVLFAVSSLAINEGDPLVGIGVIS
jgi:predicted deacylase